MAARSPPQLPASRRSEPAYRDAQVTMAEKQMVRWPAAFMCVVFFTCAILTLLPSQAKSVLAEPAVCQIRDRHPEEQRRQKVEEYLSRKKTFSGVPIQENQTSVSSSRTRRATSTKLQDKMQLSTSPKPEMVNKENANKLSCDPSNGTSEKNVILNSSTITLTNSVSGTNYNPEDCTFKDEVIEIKSQHVSLSKSFLLLKSIKEKKLMAEKQNSSVSLPKKPVLGTYRGKVIQSKINSFRKAPNSEGEKSSLPDKKILLSTTKPANKPSDKAAINSQSGLKKQQPTSAVAPKKAAVQKTRGGRGPQPPKATSNNSDRRVPGVKRSVDFCQDARSEAPAKRIPVVPIKSGQHSKTDGNRKSLLPKESAEERRARLDEWRASRGKVMRRPPISVLLGPQSKNEEQEFSSGDSLEHVLHSEKVNKTLAECLQLTKQGCQGDDVRAMLEDLTRSIPGAKKLPKYWICCMRLEQTSPLEKIIAVYEEAILAGAMPRDELRHTLIDTMKNAERLFKSEDGGTVIEAHLSEVVEDSKEPHSPVEQIREAFKDLSYDDEQKTESDDKTAETISEVSKKEEILPKKNKKHKTKERTRKKGKCETEEQKEDEIKDMARAVNSPEKENDTPYLMKYNSSTTPYLERQDYFSVKMNHEVNDSSAKIVTPLRYSQRLREKMCKLSDTVQDPCISSFDQLGELELKATASIHKQSNVPQETSVEVEE